MSPLLAVKGLDVDIVQGSESKAILRDVSLEVGEGQIRGLVGESGAGKSMTGRAITRLIPTRARARGSIEFDGTSVLDLAGRELREYRARSVATIFQDAAAHMNPLLRIDDFMTEAMTRLGGISSKEATRRSAALLEEVGVDDPSRILRQYPHQLSGGLLQRVMIGGALSMDPRLLVADEPTTALDVTTQQDVMTLLDRLRRERGLAVLLITHDLALAATVCDDVTVLYAGAVLESAGAREIYEHPLSPYTANLLAARPNPRQTLERLAAIPGRPLAADEAPPDQCAFAGRCDLVIQDCREAAVPLTSIDGGRWVRCVRVDPNGSVRDG